MAELTGKETDKLLKRIMWLKDKLREMRRVGGPDYTPNKQLWGRVEGEIGGLQWVLRELVG